VVDSRSTSDFIEALASMSVESANSLSPLQDFFKKPLEDLTPISAPCLGKDRVVGCLLIQVISQIPAEGQVQGAFLRQSPFRGDAIQIAQHQHFEHYHRVHGRLARMRIEGCAELANKL
jgi:hypothetical protein